MPTRASLTGTTPLVAAYPESKFDQYAHLKLFGCLCYVVIPLDKQKSWLPKSRMCIFLGYVWNSTLVYKMMNITTHHIFMSVSIRWDEQLFPGLPNQAPNPQASNPQIPTGHL